MATIEARHYFIYKYINSGKASVATVTIEATAATEAKKP